MGVSGTGAAATQTATTRHLSEIESRLGPRLDAARARCAELETRVHELEARLDWLEAQGCPRCDARLSAVDGRNGGGRRLVFGRRRGA
jgi:hypothetical protein